ncbi:hypothetical protein DSECCO2_446780 [anaerobic digester metagenome]
MHGIFYDIKVLRVKYRFRAHAQIIRLQFSGIKAFHQPRDHPAHRDGIEAEHIGMMIQLFSSPLVKNAAQRTHGLVGLIILLVFVAQLLADGRAGFTAGSLLFGFDGLLIELFQVVVQDKLLLHLHAEFFAPVHRLIIKCQQFAAHGGIVYPESAAGIEVRIKTVFGGNFEVFGRQFLCVAIFEPFIGHLTVAEVFIDMGPPVNYRRDAVFLKQC